MFNTYRVSPKKFNVQLLTFPEKYHIIFATLYIYHIQGLYKTLITLNILSLNFVRMLVIRFNSKSYLKLYIF